MHGPALQPDRRRVIHTRELPHRVAVGNNGVRERLIASQGQCTVHIDRIAGMRYSCARRTGTQNKSA
jgi:hypothetical protein